MIHGAVYSGRAIYHRLDGSEIHFANAHNCVVTDDRGQSLVDFVCGHGPVIIGHDDDEFLDGLSSRLRSGIIFPGYSTTHVEYADVISEDCPGDWFVSYFKSGSEAITAAVRIAALATLRKGLIRCGYLGWHDVQLAKTGLWHEPLDSPFRTMQRLGDGMRGVSGEEFVYNWTDLRLQSIVDFLSAHAARTAAFALDAYQIALAKESDVVGAFQKCKDLGIVTILDETKTGGRIAPGHSARQFKIQPDIIVLGKCLSNGFPISLLLVDSSLVSTHQSARVGGTFSKELSSIYAALETRKIMRRRDGWNRLSSIGAQVVQLFNAASKNSGTFDLVSAHNLFNGSMWELRFSEILRKDKEKRSLLPRAMADQGVLLLEGHPNFVCLSHAEFAAESLLTSFEVGLAKWMQLTQAEIQT